MKLLAHPPLVRSNGLLLVVQIGGKEGEEKIELKGFKTETGKKPF